MIPPETAASLCPTCRTSLPEGVLAGICPVCAWNESGATEAVAAGGLFAIAGHDVLAELGRGGGGIVYRARQRQPRREVAIKMLPPTLLVSPDMQARFRLEAETIASLHHPAILPVYSVGEHDGLPYFTMKLAAGGSLAARRDELRGRWRDIATLVIAIAEAVQHAHSRGVVHRDLKPGNVLFDEAGQPYVADFGVAKFATAEPSVTRTTTMLGTPAYVAPEVATGGAGAATTSSDVYGLGAILYELLAGVPPFAGPNVPELLQQIARDLPVPPSRRVKGVPRDLEVLCLRCLEKDPARRLPSATALAEDLRRWLEHRPILARPVPPAERAVQWARRNPALATLSLLLAAALAGGAIVLARSNRELRRALAQAGESERVAADSLHRSLVAQARLRRLSGEAGQRHETVEILQRAADIRRTAEVRSEVAAALARPDIRFERQLLAAFVDEAATLAFAPDFQSYLSYSGRGDFAQLSAAETKILRRFKPAGDGRARHFGWSGDGRRLTAVFVDGRTEVWSIDGETPMWTLPARGAAPPPCALHPQEPVCAWADDAGRIVRRDLGHGGEQPLTAAGAPVLGLAYSPDGTSLAVVRQGGIALIDSTSGGERWRRRAAALALAPVWSADGRWLAIAIEDSEVLVCDVATGAPIRTVSNGGGPPRLMAFHPGGRRIAIVDGEGVLCVCDVRSGEAILKAGLAPRVFAFSPDGRRFAAARNALDAAVFSWAEETLFREFDRGAEGKERSWGMSLSGDGRWIATADSLHFRLWDASRGEEIARQAFAKRDWTAVAFHPDGRRLVYGGAESGVFQRPFAITQSDAASRATATFGPEEPLGENRDGRPLDFGANGRDWFIDREKASQIVVWPGGDPKHERVIAAGGHHERPVVSPDGKWVITMGYPLSKVRVTAVGSGREPIVLPLGQKHAGAAFSPDGRWLITGTDAEYQLWSLPALAPKAKWPRKEQGHWWGTAAFSPDGRWVAVELHQGEIALRDLRTFDEPIVLIPPVRVAPEWIAWSPDSTRLYVLGAGHRVCEWNLAEVRRELAQRGLEW